MAFTLCFRYEQFGLWIHFFALNKDILTVDDFKVITFGHFINDQEVVRNAADFIISPLLQQVKKTLLIIDEHDALFEPKISLHPLLNPLIQLSIWNGKGCYVVFTGTAHTNFEREYIKNGMFVWFFLSPLYLLPFLKSY